MRRDSRYLVPTVLELMKTEAKGAALRRALKMTFEGEAGVDEGGILSEVRKGGQSGRYVFIVDKICFNPSDAGGC